MNSFNPRIKDETGKRYGKLTVISMSDKKARRHRCWVCTCDCGRAVIVDGTKLRNGHTRSCGCIKGKVKHGQARRERSGGKTNTYETWKRMRQRCLDKNLPDYVNYGGRGIKICDRWLESYNNFFKDMGEKPRGMTLERINVNGDYTPKNCKWATWLEQRRNTRLVKLSINKAKKIRCLYIKGISGPKLATKFGVSSSHIYSVLNNKSWVEKEGRIVNNV